jgi:hypothetical protein
LHGAVMRPTDRHRRTIGQEGTASRPPTSRETRSALVENSAQLLCCAGRICSILYGVQPPWAGRSTGSTEACPQGSQASPATMVARAGFARSCTESSRPGLDAVQDRQKPAPRGVRLRLRLWLRGPGNGLPSRGNCREFCVLDPLRRPNRRGLGVSADRHRDKGVELWRAAFSK